MLHANSISCQLGAKLVLRDVSLKIGKGDFISLVGPNGSGKTTLLRCLLGLVRFEGSVQVLGKDILDCSRKEIATSIGYVPQIVGSLPDFTVEQFVAMGRYTQQTGIFGRRLENDAAINAALNLTNTSEYKRQRVSSLSGGERQRVLLAATLVQEPEIILLDEPASFLDPKHEVELCQTLQSLHRDHGKGICIVSHNINSATATSDRIVALKDGQIVFDGKALGFMTTENLEGLYETSFTVVRCPQRDEDYAITRFPRHVG